MSDQEPTIEYVIAKAKATLERILIKRIQDTLIVWKHAEYDQDRRLMLDFAFHELTEKVVKKSFDLWVSLQCSVDYKAVDTLPLLRQWIDELIKKHRFHTSYWRENTIHDLATALSDESLNTTVTDLEARIVARVPKVIHWIEKEINEIATRWQTFKVTAEVWNASNQPTQTD